MYSDLNIFEMFTVYLIYYVKGDFFGNTYSIILYNVPNRTCLMIIAGYCLSSSDACYIKNIA